MQSARLILSSISVLAITACAPADDSEKERGSGSPLGLEFAVAGDNDRPDTEAEAASVRDLLAEDLALHIESGQVTLIDVRTPEEFAEGHIAGATLMPLDEFDPAVIDDDPSMTVVLYCRSGRRSRIAGEQLAEHTGEQANHLDGGIIAWEEAGYLVETP